MTKRCRRPGSLLLGGIDALIVLGFTGPEGDLLFMSESGNAAFRSSLPNW